MRRPVGNRRVTDPRRDPGFCPVPVERRQRDRRDDNHQTQRTDNAECDCPAEFHALVSMRVAPFVPAMSLYYVRRQKTSMTIAVVRPDSALQQDFCGY